MADTDFNEELLRDIARISQGNYYTPRQFSQGIGHLPLSPRLPQRSSRRPLASSWLLFAAITAAFLAEWAARRHLGLKYCALPEALADGHSIIEKTPPVSA